MLAKEAEESQARLRKLKDERLKRIKPEQTLYSARRRHETDLDPGSKRRRNVAGSELGGKRRRVSEEDEQEPSHVSRRHEDRPRHSRRTDDMRTERHTTQRAERSRRRSDCDLKDESPDEDKRYRGKHKHRDRSTELTREARRRHKHRRSQSPQRSSSRSREVFVKSYRPRDRKSRSPRKPRSPAREPTTVDTYRPRSDGSRYRPQYADDTQSYEGAGIRGARSSRSVSPDSDPLESIIGPIPPSQPAVRSRGRGAFTDRSTMDRHFSSTYDPTVDVEPEPEAMDDWDQALEALRDRQKWKQRGAERLKAAGFTDEEVRKWQRGGELTEEDVRWSKRGESREWDRGKTVNDEGTVAVEPAWGRLGGT